MLLSLLLNIAESQPDVADALVSSSLSSYPAPTDDLGLGWMFVKVIVSMVLVCGLAFAAIKWLLPKTQWAKKNESSSIKILERVSIEPRKSLYLVKVKDKTVLVGSSENSLNALLEFEDEEQTHS